MKILTIRLPQGLAAQIEAEARRRKLSKSDMVRERLAGTQRQHQHAATDAIGDLIGSINGLPRDLSAQTKAYLRSTGYGAKRHR